MFKDAGDNQRDDLANIFSRDEMTRLWNQFNHRRKCNKDLQSAWEATEQMGRGQIQRAKRGLLYEWLANDRKLTDVLLKECKFLVDQTTTGNDIRWVSYGRLTVLVGETEAQELIQILPKRPREGFPGKYHYQYSEQYLTTQKIKGKAMNFEVSKNPEAMGEAEDFLKVLEGQSGDELEESEVKKRPAAAAIQDDDGEKSQQSQQSSKRPKTDHDLAYIKLLNTIASASKVVMQGLDLKEKMKKDALNVARAERLEKFLDEVENKTSSLKQCLKDTETETINQASEELNKMITELKNTMKNDRKALS